MALQAGLNGSRRRGKKPARQHQEKAEVQQDNAGSKPQRVEDAPFYRDAIEAFQATLTEEKKRPSTSPFRVTSWTVEQPLFSAPFSHRRR